MPIISRLLRSDTVAAPSIIFLAFLIYLWFIPHIFNGGTLPSQSIPVLAFFCVAMISSVVSFFIDIPSYKDFSVQNSMLQSIATLLIGIGFYLTSATFPKDEKALSLALKVINWSGLIVLVWTAMQIVAWYGFHHYPDWMFDLQGVISSRVLYRSRVTGTALEPSWFAHQLNMLYLPIWFSASIRKYTSHEWKILGFTFENVLFLAGVGALLLTFSRIGYVGFLCMVSVVLVIMNIRFVNYLSELFSKKAGRDKPDHHLPRKIVVLLVSISLVLAYLLLLFAGLYVLSQVDPRMKDIFNFSKEQGKDNPILRYLNNMQVGERVVYWLAGWNIFNDHPILGVGLGNAGFFLPQKITPYGWTLIEVRKLAFRMHVLLNLKNLWVRLLAETGIVGFSVFVSWLFTLVLTGVNFLKNNKKIISTLTLAGLFTIVALLAEGFSVDSFALPYFWVSLGLMTSAINLQK